METKKGDFVYASTKGRGQTGGSQRGGKNQRLLNIHSFWEIFLTFFFFFGRVCILFKHMVTLLKEARKALVSQDLSQLHIHFVIFLITNKVGPPRNNYTEHKH